jgi:hypothetical protein
MNTSRLVPESKLLNLYPEANLCQELQLSLWLKAEVGRGCFLPLERLLQGSLLA